MQEVASYDRAKQGATNSGLTCGSPRASALSGHVHLNYARSRRRGPALHLMPPRPPSYLWRRPLPSTHARLALPSRPYSASTPKTPSRHALFYSDLVPGMIPVALLGSAIYLVRLLCLPVFPI